MVFKILEIKKMNNLFRKEIIWDLILQNFNNC